MEITFTFDRETKGTVRYAEDGPRASQIVGTLYVRKTAFSGTDYPATVTVTLAFGEVSREADAVPFPQTNVSPVSPSEVVPIVRKAKAPKAKKDTSGLPETITPAPSCEGMYADFLARVTDGARKVNTGRKRRQRKHEADADYQWRMSHPAEDRFLAHCEVGGLILRRWATDDGTGQIVVFPATPGTLTPGETRTLMPGEVLSVVSRELVAA